MSQFCIHGWADVTVTVSIKPKTGFPTSFGYIQKFQALFTGNPCELHLRKVFPAFFCKFNEKKALVMKATLPTCKPDRHRKNRLRPVSSDIQDQLLPRKTQEIVLNNLGITCLSVNLCLSLSDSDYAPWFIPHILNINPS